MPNNTILSLVVSLPWTTIQVTKLVLGILQGPQIKAAQGTVVKAFLQIFQVELIEKEPCLSGVQKTLSGPWPGCKVSGVLSIRSLTSQVLAMGHFQAWSQTISLTLDSQLRLVSYIILSPNLSLKEPRGCQLSYHRKVFKPSPIACLIRG